MTLPLLARELRDWGSDMCGRYAALVGVASMAGTLLTGPSIKALGPRGHTCDQHRSRFGHYGCYTSCRKRANDPELSACFRHGKNSTYPEDQGYDHCHASTCANDTLYVDTLMRTVENKLCVDKRRQYATGMSVGGEHDRVQALA